MNIVSACCKASIVSGIQHESPLGDRFTIAYKTECCESCGQEAAQVEVCDCCGEEPDHRGFKQVDGADWCVHCVNEEVDRMVEHLKMETGLAG